MLLWQKGMIIIKRKFTNRNGRKSYLTDSDRKNQENLDRTLIDRDWFHRRWVDKYIYERDWFLKNWVERYKFSKI